MPGPSFLIIGAQKSGTTSLYQYLSQHPQIFMSDVKEPNFFAFEGQQVNYHGPDNKPASINLYSVTDWDAYQRLFANAGSASAVGEASTLYMAVPGTAERIRRRIPDVRIIAMLRDPVDRAYSSFLHCRRTGREPFADFDIALQHEHERIADKWGFLWRYETLGYYYEQLAPYFAVFPREQILTLLFDDLVRNPDALISRVLEHISVDSTVKIDSSEHHNVSGEPKSVRLQTLVEGQGTLKSMVRPLVPAVAWTKLRGMIQRYNLTKPAMSADTRLRLRAVYRDDILSLAELTELNLDRWLRMETA